MPKQMAIHHQHTRDTNRDMGSDRMHCVTQLLDSMASLVDL